MRPSRASAINEFGQIAGEGWEDPTNLRAFRWENGSMVKLGTLGGDHVYAEGINDLGQVVGTSLIAGPSLIYHAFLWDNGTMVDLHSSGSQSSRAYDINNNGQVVGQTGDFAFGWDGSVMYALPPVGGDFSIAHAINDRGQIAGASRNTEGAIRAVLWQAGAPVLDLGTLGGSSSYGRGINELGQVVGESYLTPASPPYHAFMWEHGIMHDLGTLGSPGHDSSASDINELGQVVGHSVSFAGTHAFLWMDGVMYNLGSLPGTTHSNAVSINNLGEVAGTVELVTGETKAVRWQVVLRANMDVDPSSPTNTIRSNAGGALSVAVFGSPWFDAGLIDPTTVTLGGEVGGDTPVARSGKGAPRASVRDVNRDGHDDLLVEFDRKRLAANGDLTATTEQLVLLGTRTDGRRVRGVAAVTVQ